MPTTARLRLLWALRLRSGMSRSLLRLALKIQRFLCIVVFSLSSVCVTASPRISYLLHCGGCHLPDGRGVPPEVPSLRDELGKLVQIPGGRDYIVRVPGASQAPISDQALADVLNFVLLEFNNDTLAKDFQPLLEAEVTASRKNILLDPFKYRDQLWRSYNR